LASVLLSKRTSTVRLITGRSPSLATSGVPAKPVALQNAS